MQEGEWWHNPGTQIWHPNADQNIYQFDFYPPAPDAFVQTEGTIYWLSVKYRYEGPGQFPIRLEDHAGSVERRRLLSEPGQPGRLERPRLSSAASVGTRIIEPGLRPLRRREQQAKDWGDAPDDPLNPNDYPTLSRQQRRQPRDRRRPGRHCLSVGTDDRCRGRRPADAGRERRRHQPAAGPRRRGWRGLREPVDSGGRGHDPGPGLDRGLPQPWIDLNADNDWADPGERIFTDLPVGAGLNSRLHVARRGANRDPPMPASASPRSRVPPGIDVAARRRTARSRTTG